MLPLFMFFWSLLHLPFSICLLYHCVRALLFFVPHLQFPSISATVCVLFSATMYLVLFHCSACLLFLCSSSMACPLFFRLLFFLLYPTFSSPLLCNCIICRCWEFSAGYIKWIYQVPILTAIGVRALLLSMLCVCNWSYIWGRFVYACLS